MRFNAYTSFVKELLFPLFCVSCRKEGERWCKECLNGISFGVAARCPVCAEQTKQGEPCEICRSSSYLDRISVVDEYNEQKSLGKIIKEFKYHGALDVQELWNVIFKKWLEQNSHLFLEHNFSLIPIPLHPRRERERGFNQAALLAACLKNQFSQFEYIEQNLIRTRYTKQQAKLSREERIKNTQEAFSWRGEIVPEHVLLVDDVFTTGSTMQECAKVLKQAGSKVVYGFVVGRG